jgi:hypothetical protein
MAASDSSLNLYNMAGCFIILIAGLVCALIVGVIEFASSVKKGATLF